MGEVAIDGGGAEGRRRATEACSGKHEDAEAGDVLQSMARERMHAECDVELGESVATSDAECGTECGVGDVARVRLRGAEAGAKVDVVVDGGDGDVDVQDRPPQTPAADPGGPPPTRGVAGGKSQNFAANPPLF